MGAQLLKYDGSDATNLRKYLEVCAARCGNYFNYRYRGQRFFCTPFHMAMKLYDNIGETEKNLCFEELIWVLQGEKDYDGVEARLDDLLLYFVEPLTDSGRRLLKDKRPWAALMRSPLPYLEDVDEILVMVSGFARWSDPRQVTRDTNDLYVL